MKRISIFLVSSTFLFISCTFSTDHEKKFQDCPTYKINLEKLLDKTEPIKLSSIGQNIKYILLETNPSSLLTKINNITLSDSFIFVSDINKLLQFDRQGKFIRQIGSKGRGPGEYSAVWDFYVDNSKDMIYIPSYYGENKLFIFDFKGALKRSEKIDFQPMNLIQIDSNRLMFYMNNITHPKSIIAYSWYITTTHGAVLSKFKNFTKREKMPGYGVPATPLYMYKKTAHFMEFGIDTLYSLKGLSKEPYAIFNFGDLKMDTDPDILDSKLSEEYNKKYWITSMLEDNRNIYIDFVKGLGGPNIKGIFNKQDSLIRILENGAFENDLDNGLPFWPKEIINDTILLDFVNGYQFLNFLNENWSKFSSVEQDSFQKIKKNLSETSNPVLVIVN